MEQTRIDSPTDMEPRKFKITKAQKYLLADLVEANPILLHPTFSPHFTVKQANRMWQGIANKLNTIPGSNRDYRRWRKCWQDLKKDARKKAAKQKRFETSGHGEGFKCILSSFDKRVLSIVEKKDLLDKTTVQPQDVFREENISQKAAYEEIIKEESIDIKTEQEAEECCSGSDKNITLNAFPLPSRTPMSLPLPITILTKSEQLVSKEDPKEFVNRSLDKTSQLNHNNKLKETCHACEKAPQKTLTRDEYMQRKLDLLERNTKANEDIARAQERKAAAAEQMAADVARVAKRIVRISNSFKKS